MTYLNNGVTNGAVWYVVNGGRQDYVTYSLGGREVTIEIDDTKATPATQLETLWNNNHRSFLRYISESLTRVHGFVTDSLTGLPVEAEVFIRNHDADSSQVISGAITGDYTRLLPHGSWDIIFVADGYKPHIAENILVTSDETTRLDVIMAKITVDDFNIYPVPSSGYVKIALPGKFSGDIRVTVATISGRMVADFKDACITDTPLEYDLSHLSRGVYIVTVRSLDNGAKSTGKMVIMR